MSDEGDNFVQIDFSTARSIIDRSNSHERGGEMIFTFRIPR